MNLLKKNKKGFTLVETLVAISILLIGLSATFSVASFGLSSSAAVKDRITAYYLAQEALEEVRNLKDQNLLIQNADPDFPSDHDWLDGLLREDVQSGPCAIGSCDYDLNGDLNGGNKFIACGNNDCPILKIDANGFHTHSYTGSAVDSKFRREIEIEELPLSLERPEQRQARVTVTVSWASRSFVATNVISNWFAP